MHLVVFKRNTGEKDDGAVIRSCRRAEWTLLANVYRVDDLCGEEFIFSAGHVSEGECWETYFGAAHNFAARAASIEGESSAEASRPIQREDPV
jgi:hypothetical protein